MSTYYYHPNGSEGILSPARSSEDNDNDNDRCDRNNSHPDGNYNYNYNYNTTAIVSDDADDDDDDSNNRQRSSSWSPAFVTKYKKKKMPLLKKGSIPAAPMGTTNANVNFNGIVVSGYNDNDNNNTTTTTISTTNTPTPGRKRDLHGGSANTLKIGNVNLATPTTTTTTMNSPTITGASTAATAANKNKNHPDYTHGNMNNNINQNLDQEDGEDGEEFLLLQNAAGFPHNLSPTNSEVMDLDNTNSTNNTKESVNYNNMQYYHDGNVTDNINSNNKKKKKNTIETDNTPRISGGRRNVNHISNNKNNNSHHYHSITQHQRLDQQNLHLNENQRQHRRSQSLGNAIRVANLIFPLPSLSISNDTAISSLSDTNVNELDETNPRLQVQRTSDEEWEINGNYENNIVNQMGNSGNAQINNNNDVNVNTNANDEDNNENDDDSSSNDNDMNMHETYPPNFNNIAVIDTSAVAAAAAVAITGTSTTLMASSTASITDETTLSSTTGIGIGREYLTKDYYVHSGGGGAAAAENGLIPYNNFDNTGCDEIEYGHSKKNFIVYTNIQNNYGEDENRSTDGDIDESNSALGGAGAGVDEDDNNQLYSYNNTEKVNSLLQSPRHHHQSHRHRRFYSNDLSRLSSNSNDYDMNMSVNSKSLVYSNSNDFSVTQRDGYNKLPHSDLGDNSRQDQQMASNNKPMGYIESFFQWFGQKFCWCCPRPSWSRASSAVVRYAPCFCCADKLETSATDRMLLTRLNTLCAIMSLAQFAVGVFILIVFLSDAIVDRELGEEDNIIKEALTPNLWMMSGCLLLLSVVGLFTFCTMIVITPKIKQVNLHAAIRFMWILYWILPLQILLVIALFDYHQVTEVWIRHWWSGPSMAWFRGLFCEEGTANTKCKVPIEGIKDSDQKESWCEQNYNATDCIPIRKAATDLMESAAYFFLYTNAIAGAVLIIFLLLALGLLEGIISAPIVQRSKESNISLWLTLPIIGSLVGGAALLYTPQSLLRSDSGAGLAMIGIWYLVTGATFTISALLGWFISAKTVLNLRDKTQKEIAVYLFIFMLILAIFAVGSVFAVSLVFTLNIVKVGINDESRGEIACLIDAAASCSCCVINELDESEGMCDKKCPEWQTGDVVRIIQTQLKQSASLAAIFFLYAFSALRFGFSLRASVSKYEIDYV